MSRIAVVMGVTGSGKTTLARALARKLGASFQEGDALHPPGNIAKMSDGIALDDADRAPWLAAIEHWMESLREQDRRGVVSCSALRRAYREQLRRGRPELVFLYLRGSRTEISRRLRARRDHFMPPQMLEQQFEILEEPAAGEPVSVIEIDGRSPEEVLHLALERFRFWT